MKAIILAAGLGSRLGGSVPKPLSILKDNQSIIGYQIKHLESAIGIHNIIVVVGYKFQDYMNQFPSLTYVYNKNYCRTNCCKSLLMGLNKVENEDVIFLDGDVYFDYGVLPLLLESHHSAAIVKEKVCGEEETKYDIDENGYIRNFSKKVVNGKGESIGVILIRKEDLVALKSELNSLGDNDFYAPAINNLTSTKRIKMTPIYIGGLFCEEIDFPEDLELVRKYLRNFRQ